MTHRDGGRPGAHLDGGGRGQTPAPGWGKVGGVMG